MSAEPIKFICVESVLQEGGKVVSTLLCKDKALRIESVLECPPIVGTTYQLFAKGEFPRCQGLSLAALESLVVTREIPNEQDY